MTKLSEYLQRKAENWVSHTVLVGCSLIAFGLLYVSFQADAIGNHYTDKAGHDSVEDLLKSM